MLLTLFGKRTCKPNSVVCGHSSRRSVAAYAHQRPTRRFRQLLKPPERIGQMRSPAWLFAKASLPIWSCSVWGLPCPRLHSRSGALLPHLFTLTSARSCPPGEPFGPFRDALLRGVAEAVSFLWHWPSVSLKAHIPDVIRHTALRSSDFPPPASAVNGSRQRPPGPPASLQCIPNQHSAPRRQLIRTEIHQWSDLAVSSPRPDFFGSTTLGNTKSVVLSCLHLDRHGIRPPCR